MPPQKSNIIKVLGFGGGGGNAVNHMYLQQIQNVDFIVCNTDAQALAQSSVPNKIQLGPHLTQGLGAGANPSIGRQATEESLEEIRRIMEVNTRMAFITAGMGGGTGTGGAPTVAKICKDLGILTVGIVTTPFAFEGPKRMAQAQAGINELKEHVDTLLVISNDKLRHQYGNLKMKEAFSKADNVLTTAARCITDVINTTGAINVDFADVCTVMRDGGVAILGSAQVAGEDRALKAIEAAINSPLLNDNDIAGAKWLLLNITSSEGEFEFTMDEVEMIQDYVRKQTGDSTDVILGMGYDDTLGENLGITIIATGFQHKDPFMKPVVKKAVPKPEPQIIMTLGVEGEERKMYEQPAVKREEAAAFMPVIAEESPVAQQQQPIVMEEPLPVAANGYVPFIAPTVEEVKHEAEAPLYFELSTEVASAPEPAMKAVTTEQEDVHAKLRETLGFHKPSQVYNSGMAASALDFTPYIKSVEEKKAEEIQIQQPTPNHAPLTFDLEETLAPVMKLETSEEEEETAGISLVFEEPTPAPAPVQNPFFNNEKIVVDNGPELTEEESQKKRALERINRLRNLSFNPMEVDNNSEFETVPSYMRRNMELHNSIANVEDFYSRAQVKTDDKNDTTISTLNNFLHGKKPD